MFWGPMCKVANIPHLHLGIALDGQQLSLALQSSQVALCLIHVMLAFDQSLLQHLAMQLTVHQELLHLLQSPICLHAL